MRRETLQGDLTYSQFLALHGARVERSSGVPVIPPSANSVGWLSRSSVIPPSVRRRRRSRPYLDGEFDPGSGRTLAARLKHASRTRNPELAPGGKWRTGEEHVRNLPRRPGQHRETGANTGCPHRTA